MIDCQQSNTNNATGLLMYKEVFISLNQTSLDSALVDNKIISANYYDINDKQNHLL